MHCYATVSYSGNALFFTISVILLQSVLLCSSNYIKYIAVKFTDHQLNLNFRLNMENVL